LEAVVVRVTLLVAMLALSTTSAAALANPAIDEAVPVAVDPLGVVDPTPLVSTTDAASSLFAVGLTRLPERIELPSAPSLSVDLARLPAGPMHVFLPALPLLPDGALVRAPVATDRGAHPRA
jgi:hypothetical protein